MARKTSTKLFDLIRSMTRGEKKQLKFSLNSTGDSETLHIKLFDLINAQKTYDEDKLCLKLYGSANLETKKFFVLKHELYKLILKKLSQDFEQQSTNYKVKQQLMQIQVLYSKLLIDACRDILEKTKKLVKENELFTSWIEVLKWEKKIAYAALDTPFLQKEIKRIQEEEHLCLKKLAIQSDYWQLFLEQLVLTRSQQSLQDEQKKALLLAAQKNPLLALQEPKDSFESALFYYYSKSLLSYNSGDLENFHVHSKEALAYIEQRPRFKKEEFTFYISLLGNFIASCFTLKRFKEAASYIDEMKPDVSVVPNHSFRMLSRYYSFKLTIHSELGTFKEGLELMKEIQKNERKYKYAFPKDYFFFYTYFCFGLKEFDQALDCINTYLTLPKKQVRMDLESACRIMQLIICFEQKNEGLLDSQYRGTYRYLKNTFRLNGLEKLVLQFIKKSPSYLNKKMEMKALELLKKKILKLKKEPAEVMLLEYVNIEAWVESKLQSRSFPSLIKEYVED